MRRASWGSRIGFVLAVAGSAVGLANIWRFPYLVGQHGGAAFIFLYLFCLFLIGFPVFIAEILIGRRTQTSPCGAFRMLGGESWSWAGKMTIFTGFIVSSFYSAVAGWILGYFIEAVRGRISGFQSPAEVESHHLSLMEDPWWGISFHLCFILLSVLILVLGVRRGIERGNKIMMPLLIFVLLLLVIKGLSMPNASAGLRFLFSPDWSRLTPLAVILALGQAFFTLSLGQGTMVTYGSYLKQHENIIKSCVPVIIMDTLISLFAAIAIFTIVFSVGIEPCCGPSLIFHTLPWVFSQLPLGHIIAILFFLLVSLAALTSEISAMEPTIAFLMDERGWRRTPAVFACGLGAFLVGIPSALSSSLLKEYTFAGKSFLDFMDFTATSILIPLGGFAAVLLVGWVWGMPKAIEELKNGDQGLLEKKSWLTYYFWVCVKFTAPLLIVLVFLHSLGAFG